jgi:uncharacterized protein YbjQ (UPF0145 family)
VDPDRILSTMTFTSNLTVEDFAAVRSVGFAPVGQVMGVVVFRLDQKYSSCGYHLTPPDHGMVRRSAQERLQWQLEQKERRWQQEYARRTPVAAVPDTQRVLSRARRQAIGRMRDECARLGGDGVVGARLEVETFHDIGI